MASKVKFVELSSIEIELNKLANKKIIAGVVADEGSLLAKRVAANEFGAEIKPKKGKFLAIPLQPEFKGKSPKDFPDGFFNFVKSEDGESAVLMLNKVACFLLVGKVTIPERAAIRKAFDKRETQEKVYSQARAAMERILGGSGTADDLCNAIGQAVVASIKNSIASNIGPENSPLTKRLKNGTNTLIDQADFLKSIGYEVVG